MESKINEIRGYCFVHDVHGGLLDLGEVNRITIRKLVSTEPATPPEFGVAVKQRGSNDWVIMETGTYESCKTILDKFSDEVCAYDSLSAVFGVERREEEHEHHVEEHVPEPEFHEEEHDEPVHEEEYVEEAEPVEEHEEEHHEEEHAEEHEESDEESAVQELLLDE